MASPIASSRKIWSWLGPCASFICLIHCFGTGLIAAFAPGLLKLFPHSESLEWTVIAVSFVSGSLVLRKQRAAAGIWVFFAVAFLTSVLSLAAHVHEAFHVCLLVMALLPGGLLLKRHYHARKTPACCEHSHD